MVRPSTLTVSLVLAGVCAACSEDGLPGDATDGPAATADRGPTADASPAPPDRQSLAPEASSPAPDATVPPKNPLLSVKHWAYQINAVEAKGAVDRLVASGYDLLVLDPTNTTKQSPFDSKGMVARLHKTKGKSGHKRLVLAYISIGEAEPVRAYWRSWWKAPTRKKKGNPDFLLTTDPDGWDDDG